MNLHLRHRSPVEDTGGEHEFAGEPEHSTSRHRKLIATASAIALAGGIAGTALTLSNGKSRSAKASEKAPVTALKPHSSLPSTTIGTPETTTPTATQTQTPVAANLCTAVSASAISSAIGGESGNLQCTTTSDSGETLLPFSFLDISHAVWGGPEGQRPVVAVTIRNAVNGGQDQYSYEQQMESSNQEVPATVDNFSATFLPTENQELNGTEVDYETVFVDAGKYLVNVVVEQPSGGTVPSKNGMISLTSSIIQQGINL